MSDFLVILENTDKIDKRPEVVAAMAAWGTVLTCKQLQLQLGKSRAALGKYMPVHLNVGQQLRIAWSALLELVEEIQDIQDLPQNDAALVYAIFAVYHRRKFPPDETDKNRELRIADQFKTLVEDHLGNARLSGALPPPPHTQTPSPVPELPLGRSDIDDIRREMAERFDLTLEKQRLAMAEDNRLREIRVREELEHDRRRLELAFEDRARQQRDLAEDRERKLRLEHDEELRRAGRESASREEQLRREADVKGKSFDELNEQELQRLYEELSVSGDCGQAMSRLGKYGAQHEPTDSEGEESCKKSIIRRVAKARRGIPDERQRLWYAGFAELATTFEVVNHMDKFKAELLTSFRHDDAARFDGLVDMVRLVHKLMLRGAKVGSKQTVRTDAPTTTSWDPITRRMFHKIWFGLTKQIWELAVMVKYDNARRNAQAEYQAELQRQHDRSLKDWWVVVDFAQALKNIDVVMQKAITDRRKQDVDRGRRKDRGGGGRGGGRGNQPRHTTSPGRPPPIATTPSRPGTPQGSTGPRSRYDKETNSWVFP